MNFYKFVTLTILLCSVFTVSANVDYCKIKTCDPGQHTMCKYPDDKVHCGNKKVVKVGLSIDEKKAILQQHNKLRQKIANGEEPKVPFKASNMMKFRWHKEAARIAQRWVDQCSYGHDKCRNLEKDQVGQSVGLGQSIEQLVKLWYEEVNVFKLDAIDHFRFEGAYGHFAQFIWAETTAVGCGYVEYNDGNTYVFLACNYVPSGLFEGQSLFKKGDPSSKCNKNSRSKLYPGLCLADGDDDTDNIPAASDQARSNLILLLFSITSIVILI